MSSTWDEIHASREWGKYPPEHVIRWVARNWYGVADRSQVRLLDIGCGQGACTWYMGREGFSVWAVDSSPAAIEKLELRIATEDDACIVHTAVGDIANGVLDVPLIDGALDNFCTYILSDADQRKAIAEAHRVLKPGGKFLSCSFGTRTTGYNPCNQIEPDVFNPTEGPLAGLGPATFRQYSELHGLYDVFGKIEIDSLEWTTGGGKVKVEAWIVEGTK